MPLSFFGTFSKLCTMTPNSIDVSLVTPLPTPLLSLQRAKIDQSKMGESSGVIQTSIVPMQVIVGEIHCMQCIDSCNKLKESRPLLCSCVPKLCCLADGVDTCCMHDIVSTVFQACNLGARWKVHLMQCIHFVSSLAPSHAHGLHTFTLVLPRVESTFTFASFTNLHRHSGSCVVLSQENTSCCSRTHCLHIAEFTIQFSRPEVLTFVLIFRAQCLPARSGICYLLDGSLKSLSVKTSCSGNTSGHTPKQQLHVVEIAKITGCLSNNKT